MFAAVARSTQDAALGAFDRPRCGVMRRAICALFGMLLAAAATVPGQGKPATALGEVRLLVEYSPGRTTGAARVELRSETLGETRVSRALASEPLRIEELQPGTYEVRVMRAGFLPVTQQVSVLRGQVAAVRTVLVASGVIRGIVTDHWGDPLVNTPVTAASKSGGASTFRDSTDEAGFFQVSGIPAGAWQVCAGLRTRVCHAETIVLASPDESGLPTRQYEQAGRLSLSMPASDSVTRGAIVVDAADSVSGVTISAAGEVVPGVPIFLTSSDRRYKRITGSRGEFDVSGMIPGSYTVSVGPGSFALDGQISRPIGSETLSVARLTLQVRPLASIDGQVLDAFGDPLEGVTVSAFEVQFVSGRRRLVRIDQTGAKDETDRGGTFHLHGLSARAVVVGAMPALYSGRGPRIDHSFYPGVPHPSGAEVLSLAQQVGPRWAPFSVTSSATWSVAGKVVPSSGDGLPTGIVVLMPSPDGPMATFDPASTSLAGGKFVFRGIPAGSYTIQVRTAAAGPQSSPGFGAIRVDVPGAREEVTVSVGGGHTLKGRLHGGGSPKAFEDEMKEVVAHAVDYDSWPVFDRARGPIDSNGEFELRGLHGRRVLSLPQSSPYVVVSVSRGPLTSPDGILNLDSGDIESVDVTVEEAAVFEGRVAGAGELDEVLVVAWSTDDSQWQYPSRRVLSARVSADGNYRMPGLLAGSYWITAWRGLGPTLWQDPSTLRSLVPFGQRLNAVAGAIHRVDLTVRSMQR